ncbi:MAG: hypothetical protein M1829_001970 [Trizodia sp. TS-e1964]|nr:MAG: hypothetical protein M1829_001970 [Trizodia sp. TS-e1964]
MSTLAEGKTYLKWNDADSAAKLAWLSVLDPVTTRFINVSNYLNHNKKTACGFTMAQNPALANKVSLNVKKLTDKVGSVYGSYKKTKNKLAATGERLKESHGVEYIEEQIITQCPWFNDWNPVFDRRRGLTVPPRPSLTALAYDSDYELAIPDFPDLSQAMGDIQKQVNNDLDAYQWIIYPTLGPHVLPSTETAATLPDSTPRLESAKRRPRSAFVDVDTDSKRENNKKRPKLKKKSLSIEDALVAVEKSQSKRFQMELGFKTKKSERQLDLQMQQNKQQHAKKLLAMQIQFQTLQNQKPN